MAFVHQTMIHSGIAAVDETLGGFVPQRVHVVTGGPGSGKTALAWQFLRAGLERGESVLLLSSGRVSDVKSLARHLGFDPDTYVRSGKLVMLRFRNEFASRFAFAASAAPVFQDLSRLLGSLAPTRIAVDSFAPFLAEGSAAGDGIAALSDWLERSDATSLVTFPGDIASAYDRRLEPMVQSAAALMTLSRAPGNRHTLTVVTAHREVTTESAAFVIRRGEGIVAAAPDDSVIAEGPATEPARSRVHAADSGPRRVLYLHDAEGASADLLAAMRACAAVLDVEARSWNERTVLGGFGAAVVEARHGALSAARTLVRTLDVRGDDMPIVVAAPFTIRSADRAQLLRAGADEVLAGDMAAAELDERLTAALGRPHRPRTGEAEFEVPRLTHRQLAGDLRPLTGEELARALDQLRAGAELSHTIVQITPTMRSRSGVVERLADTVLRASRVDGGDLSAIVDGSVIVLLHGARQRDAEPFVDRLRTRWASTSSGTLRVACFPFSADFALPLQPRERMALAQSS